MGRTRPPSTATTAATTTATTPTTFTTTTLTTFTTTLPLRRLPQRDEARWRSGTSPSR